VNPLRPSAAQFALATVVVLSAVALSGRTEHTASTPVPGNEVGVHPGTATHPADGGADGTARSDMRTGR
jgi:hypothetical protein